MTSIRVGGGFLHLFPGGTLGPVLLRVRPAKLEGRPRRAGPRVRLRKNYSRSNQSWSAQYIRLPFRSVLEIGNGLHPPGGTTVAVAEPGSGRPDAAAYDRFQRVARLGAGYIASAMGWADLDCDDDLDLVTGSYNSELPDLGDGFALCGGVAYYENMDGGLHLTLLAPTAEALAVLVTDLNGDRRPDIIIGNDYDHPDQVFFRDLEAEGGWLEAVPFRATATNTMSYNAGDIDNDDRDELFVADMKPYRRDPEVSYAWERITILPPPDDVQANENVLLLPAPGSGASVGAVAFDNAGPQRGVDATGWTWSAKFGDLDSDGFLDLYAVNGMIDALVFGHLPGDELVEQNQALRNRGDGGFAPAPDWGWTASAAGAA